MTVFRSGRRGAGILSDRRELLIGFAAAGVIDFPGTAEVPGSTAVQYVARVRGTDRPGPWLLLDGRELGPWLLGITHALAAERGADDPTAARLAQLMAPLLQGADPVPDGAAGT